MTPPQALQRVTELWLSTAKNRITAEPNAMFRWVEWQRVVAHGACPTRFGPGEVAEKDYLVARTYSFHTQTAQKTVPIGLLGIKQGIPRALHHPENQPSCGFW